MPCRGFGGTDMSTGEILTAAVVRERVRYLADLARETTAQIVEAHWNASDVALLGSGRDASNRSLPSSGHVTISRLGWGVNGPAGVYVPDRAGRIAREHAARILRLATHRDGLVRGLVASWPVDYRARTGAEWAALWAAVPFASSKAEVRNRSRQIARWQTDHDGALPTSVTDLEPPPFVSGQILLAAADKQLVTLTRSESGVVVAVRLPCSAMPGRADWSWVQIPVRVPGHVPVSAVLHSPTLRLVGAALRVDLPWTVPVAAAARMGHVRALGLDWGVNTLFTGTVACLRRDRDGRERVVTDGRPLRFNASGVSAKLMRLRTQRERLAAKRDQYARLRTLQDKHARAEREHDRVAARLRNLGRQVAWAAARWAVDQALAHDCSAIYVEDLSTMETRGLGRVTNRRVGQHVRSELFIALRHLAARAGIAVVTVPARGTSAGCPRCLRNLQHVKAPDNLAIGHKWSICTCGLSSDRDHAAAERIVSRGLSGQFHTRVTRAGSLTIPVTVDTPVRRSRDRRTQFSHPAPLRRRTPAPAHTAGQRPAGQSPTRPEAPAPDRQGLHTRIHNAPKQHARGNRDGNGFHLLTQASPLPRITQIRSDSQRRLGQGFLPPNG